MGLSLFLDPKIKDPLVTAKSVLHLNSTFDPTTVQKEGLARSPYVEVSRGFQHPGLGSDVQKGNKTN